MNATFVAPALVAAVLAFAPVCAQGAPSESEVESELRALDAALAARDLAAYSQRFRSEQPFLHEQHERVVQVRLEAGKGLSRRTTLRSYTTMGEHAIAVVAEESFAGDAPTPTTTGFTLFALRRVDGAVRPVLAAEVPEAEFDARAVVCPYCNYAVGPAEGWLALPMATARTAAVEGTVFVRLGADLAVEVLVQLADRPQPAAEFVLPLRELVQRAPGAVSTAVAPWTPMPSVPLANGTTAARARTELADARVVEVRAVALGRLAHLFLVRGTKAGLSTHAADVDRLFASYRLLAAGADAQEQVAAALDHHCGGLLRDTEYRNERHDVRLDGPAGWAGLERCSGFLFEVLFTEPEHGGVVRLRGLAPPSWSPHWTEQAADRWLEDLCRRASTAVDRDDDSGWSDADGGFRQRTLRLRDERGGTAELRLLLRRDQLVVADGRRRDGSRADALRAAVRSLAPLQKK